MKEDSVISLADFKAARARKHEVDCRCPYCDFFEALNKADTASEALEYFKALGKVGIALEILETAGLPQDLLAALSSLAVAAQRCRRDA